MVTKSGIRFLLVAAALGIGSVGAVLGFIGARVSSPHMRKSASKSDVINSRREILSALLSDKVDAIVNGADSDQERCLRIARWIAGHMANRKPEGKGELGWWAYRSGLCGARARLFVRMCTFLHIPARVFNIYNFGGVGGGHSCAQAYYDDQWHFFDVTYAGVFIRDGKILSWEEIMSEPEDAVKHMVVFKETLDRWGSLDLDPVGRKRVNNVERMHQIYSAEILQRTRSYGFLRSPDVKTLYPVVDLSKIQGKLEIGSLDSSYKDVTKEGVASRFSERLGESLGTRIDTFHTCWTFKNCQPGKTYVLRYYIYRATHADLKYWTRSKDAKILFGATFRSSRSLVAKKSTVWEIRFQPQKNACSLQIGYDFRDKRRLLFLDKIEIGNR